MILQGTTIDLIPMEIGHLKGLTEAGQSREIWEYLTQKPLKIEDFEKYINDSLKKISDGCYPFTVITKDGTIIGSTQLRNHNTIHKTIDSSLTWINPLYWGKKINFEIKSLILDYCFSELDILRVEYVVDEKNFNSQKSLLKIGAVKEGIFRNFRLYPSGLYKNSIIFSHIKEEWITVKQKIIQLMKNEITYPEKFWAGGFLYNPKTNEVFLHKRDGNTKFNPNALAFFGGLNEKNESPEECFVRELYEEIALKVKVEEVIYLDDYLNVELDTYRCVFYVISDITKDKLTLGEGAGFEWFKIEEIFNQKITEKTERDLHKFISKIQIQ